MTSGEAKQKAAVDCATIALVSLAWADPMAEAEAAFVSKCQNRTNEVTRLLGSGDNSRALQTALEEVREGGARCSTA